jgi:formylglycine-generating enzyme
MNYKWITSFLPLSLLVGCNSEAIEITSDTVPKQQIQTIIDNINKHYPETSNALKQHTADVVVRAIENMVFVEGGSFEMGDFLAPCDLPSGTPNRIDWTQDAECLSSPGSEETGAYFLHKVTLDDYSIAKYETTFMDMEWMRQINGLPVAADDMKIPTSKVIDRNSDRYNFLMTKFPNSAAMTKSWQEGQDYCTWLSDISTLPFSLPTEAQWEYAARNRGKHVYFGTSTGYRQIDDPFFNTQKNSRDEYDSSEINALTSPENDVTALPSNPLGIYGMSNQISEWLYDWYSPDYYQNSPDKNPTGPKTGTQKVLRDAGGTTMTFDRIYNESVIDGYYNSVSFRCALN